MFPPSFLEKLASLESGRLRAAQRETAAGRLIVYPDNLTFSPVLGSGESTSKSPVYYLRYGVRGNRPFDTIPKVFSFMRRLLRVLDACKHVDLYLLSDRANQAYSVATAALCRLKGIPVTLHNYGFCHGPVRQCNRLVRSIVHHMIQDDSSPGEHDHPYLSEYVYRIDTGDMTPYRRMNKTRAIPKVLVYGDFEWPGVISLARRAHALIQQKYPRTEFKLVSLMSGVRSLRDDDPRSMTMDFPGDDNDMQALFRDADILMVLSPGGLNRMVIRRAEAAGYPIIINGIGRFAEHGRYIFVPRDSYGALADAVIRLVDDEAVYRSHAAAAV